MKNNQKILAIIATFFVLGIIVVSLGQINASRNTSVRDLNMAAVDARTTIDNRQTTLSEVWNQPVQANGSAVAAGTLSEYIPLSSIPGLTDTGTSEKTLRPYLTLLYRWGISIAVLLSIIMITIGGFQYMTTDAVFNKSEGKAKIWAAIVGLLLAASSYLILTTINPRIFTDIDSSSLFNSGSNKP